MKYFSMCSGIGGFELGIKKGYTNYLKGLERRRSEDGGDRDVSQQGSMFRTKATSALCVGFSEISKYAIQIYRKHFPSHKNYGDATKIIPEGLPDFDILCAGFPCQSFSIAGKRMGFEDTRGTLFFDIARVAKVKRPQIIFLENVKGLLNHDNGRTFATILATLDELGYNAEWQVLNSKHFGVPQNRERVFIIGHLRGTSSRQIFPLEESNKIHNGKQGQIKMIQNSGKEMARIYDTDGLSPSLTGKSGGWQEPVIMGVANALTPDAYLTRGERKKVNGKSVLTSMWERRIRRLTPTECERLQGFPDGYTQGVSDTQRYKCLGNAVTVNVIEAITERIFAII